MEDTNGAGKEAFKKSSSLVRHSCNGGGRRKTKEKKKVLTGGEAGEPAEIPKK